MSRPQRVIAVPVDLALVYSAARGWHYEDAPAAGWLDWQEHLLELDQEPRGVLTLVPPLRERRTACRPGSGPCRRRHEHVGRRRTSG